MKAEFSKYLGSIADGLKEFVSILREKYDYVSVLSTDSNGWTASISRAACSVSHRTMMTERGNVVRVCRDGLYSEYAFNDFEPGNARGAAEEAMEALDASLELIRDTHTDIYDTPVLKDEPGTIFAEMETGEMPETADLDSIVASLKELSDRALASEKDMVDCQIRAQSTHVCKMFLTPNRDLRQSYVYSEASVLPVISRDGKTVFSFEGVSGRRGPEIFRGLADKIDTAVRTANELAGADPVEPGEYTVITSPEVSGLIAHEAFGHGVEMDMFVKNRALGAEYIGKRVGSDLVTMHEGAACAEQVASYAFDDEGTPAGDTVEIRNGILETGVCDALAALRLGTEPTGNGKRQNFEHKVYTRMTNTVFDSGTATLDDMIKTVDSGYLLCGMQSGMEDPKHWGIQCIVERGYEIRDGKLTGRVVAPVVMTGYVPDLLGSISMISGDRELFGNGGCGKGHKEWVKVSDGGPYMKARVRLG
jgi:TldD protein